MKQKYTFKKYKHSVINKYNLFNLSYNKTGLYYVYRITNLKEKKHYYGSRTCKNSFKDTNDCLIDLISYKSSSTNTDFICEQSLNAENFKYKIVSTFENVHDCKMFECFLHSKFNVSTHLQFYNKTNALPTGFSNARIVSCKIKGTNIKLQVSKEEFDKRDYLVGISYGVKRSEETKIRIGLSSLGRKHSEETKIKIKKISTGKKRSEEAKKNISNSLIGHRHSKETIEKLKNRKITNETKIKLSQSQKEQRKIKIKCNHCDKYVDAQNFSRWHGDNCKFKENKSFVIL